jgi:hypothetical protein
MRLVQEKPKFFTIVGSGERTWVLTLRTLRTSRVRRIEHIHRTGGEFPRSPEVPKLIWVVDLRMPGNYPIHWIYDTVSPTLTTSGGWRIGNTKTPEVPKLIWVIDLRMPGDYPDHRIYDIVSPTLTTSGGQRFGNTKTPEVPKSRS